MGTKASAQGLPARTDPASVLAAIAVVPTHDDREAFLGALAGDAQRLNDPLARAYTSLESRPRTLEKFD